MPDDKDKQGKQDRSQVASGQSYEVNYFAQKHRIPKDTAVMLIEKFGNDREALNAAAKKFKSDRRVG